jgi:hypothetical protein
MSREINQWPEEIIALNQELASGLHPKLEAFSTNTLMKIGPSSSVRLQHIAICAMDGMYEVEQLCEVVEKRFCRD